MLPQGCTAYAAYGGRIAYTPADNVNPHFFMLTEHPFHPDKTLLFTKCIPQKCDNGDQKGAGERKTESGMDQKKMLIRKNTEIGSDIFFAENGRGNADIRCQLQCGKSDNGPQKQAECGIIITVFHFIASRNIYKCKDHPL